MMHEYDESLQQIADSLGTSRNDMMTIKEEMQLMSQQNNKLVSDMKALMLNTPNNVILSDSDHALNDDVIVQNLRKQLSSALREKDAAVEMWQTSCQEIERLQKELEKTLGNRSWDVVEDRVTQVEGQYMDAVNQIEGDLKSIHDNNRKLTTQLNEANEKMREKDERIHNLENDLIFMEQEQRDTTIDERAIEQYKNTNKSLEVRLREANVNIDYLKSQKSHLEAKITETHSKLLDSQRRQSTTKEQIAAGVKDMETALIERDQAVQLLHHKEERYEQLESTVTKLLNDEGTRTRQEVDLVRQQANVSLLKLTNQIHHLEVKIMEKDAMVDRLQRVKTSLMSTLDQINKDSQSSSVENTRLLDDMRDRLVETERLHDETVIRVNVETHNSQLLNVTLKEENIKQGEVIRQMNELVKKRDSRIIGLNSERQQLLEEIDRCKVELQTLESTRNSTLYNWQKKLSAAEQEQSLVVREMKAQLMATEDNHRQSMIETRKLLTAQQRLSVKWKEECHSLTHKLERKICEHREEICDLKSRNTKLVSL